jgi:hypothetical protein
MTRNVFLTYLLLDDDIPTLVYGTLAQVYFTWRPCRGNCYQNDPVQSGSTQGKST